MTFVGMTMGTVSLLSLAAAFERDRPVVLTVSGAGSILYLAVFGSVVAFVTYYWLLKRVQAVYLSLSSFINPIIAVILGAAILGERLDRSVLAGAALVLVGIAVTNWRALAARSTRSAVYTQRRER
jgi:drug/metabolite transporter (DMT)-like permease